MGLYELVTNGVALANTLTADLQVSVTHEPYASSDGYGAFTYGTAVSRKVIAQKKAKQVINQTGQLVTSDSQILLLSNVAVDARDRFTLPDGKQPPILAISGIWDKNSNVYYVEVAF
jgi:hypothetical protein